MGELLVLADEHAQLVVVHTDILVEHLFWNVTTFIYVFVQEREHHVGIVHGGLAVCLFREAIVVVVWLHLDDELVHRVVEGELLGVVSEHFSHLLLCEAHHLVEAV